MIQEKSAVQPQESVFAYNSIKATFESADSNIGHSTDVLKSSSGQTVI
jgi:hypothetical protein